MKTRSVGGEYKETRQAGNRKRMFVKTQNRCVLRVCLLISRTLGRTDTRLQSAAVNESIQV